MWQRLADLLVAHIQAEEETCYLPLFGTGAQATERMRDSVAEHDEIRGIICEAAAQPVGSAPWWRTVRTAMVVSAEHLEHEERDVLPDCLPGLSRSRRRQLGRQWCAFMAAWRPDGRLASPGRSSSGPRREVLDPAQLLGSSSVISSVAPPVAKLARSAMVERPSSEAIPARKSSTLS